MFVLVQYDVLEVVGMVFPVLGEVDPRVRAKDTGYRDVVRPTVWILNLVNPAGSFNLHEVSVDSKGEKKFLVATLRIK